MGEKRNLRGAVAAGGGDLDRRTKRAIERN